MTQPASSQSSASQPSVSQPATSNPVLTPEFWEGRYQEGTDRWDIAQPAPPFVHLLQSAQPPRPGRMAVLGAGRGHDALLFAAHGFEVIGFDFAPSAVQEATAAAQARQLNAQFLQRDIFDLPQEFSAAFDHVLEHTCFCAILPEQRDRYVQLVRSILRPGGELIGLFWAHARAGGPPFGSSEAELKQRFSQGFTTVLFEQATVSIESRKDEEYLLRLRKL